MTNDELQKVLDEQSAVSERMHEETGAPLVTVPRPGGSERWKGTNMPDKPRMTAIVLGRMPNGLRVGYIAECSLPMAWMLNGTNTHGFHSGYDIQPENNTQESYSDPFEEGQLP